MQPQSHNTGYLILNGKDLVYMDTVIWLHVLKYFCSCIVCDYFVLMYACSTNRVPQEKISF